jgi:nucleoside-diphosphate-sugar epimerase
MAVCSITGSTGFLGSNLVRLFRKKNWTVIETSRKSNRRSSDQIYFDLNNDDPISVPSNVDVLIHCAYDFKAINWQDIHRANVERTLDLFTEALSVGCKRCIFISSMSAFKEAKSFYGKAKYESEMKLLPKGVIAIRPGLIYGKQEKGIAGIIQKYVSFLPVIPMIGDGNYIFYLSHIDDLCQAIFEIAVSTEIQLTAPIVLANQEPISLKQLIINFAKEYNKKILTLPISPTLILVCLRLFEKLGLRLGLRSDSVVSILNSNPNPWTGNPWQSHFRFRSLGIR